MDRHLYERWAAGEITDQEYLLTLRQARGTMTPEGKKMPDSKAKINYDARTAYKVSLKLNRNTDADLIEMLEAADNKQALIKAAMRNYRRETKNMKAKEIIESGAYKAAVALMDDEIREAVHADLAPCTDEEFLEEYMKRHLAKYGEEFTI
jgi:hypothetical protein